MRDVTVVKCCQYCIQTFSIINRTIPFIIENKNLYHYSLIRTIFILFNSLFEYLILKIKLRLTIENHINIPP